MGFKVAIITVSDRVARGEREDAAGALAQRLVEDAGLSLAGRWTVSEGAKGVSAALDEAFVQGARVIVTTGGTGVGEHNLTPEVTKERIQCRMHGLETQVLIEGLKSSPKAGLSRGIIGLSERGENAVLIVNAPGSTGGVADVLHVILPLVEAIFERF